MARRTRRTRRHARRGISRVPRRNKKFGVVNVLKGLIAFSPVAIASYGNYQKSGGGMNGIMKGVLPTISTSYTGYNPNDGKFYASDLAVGYAPIIGVMAASKLGVFRILGKIF